MSDDILPGGFYGPGGLQIPDIDLVETLAQTYAAGVAAADQTVTLLDAKGGTIILNGAGLTGAFPYTLSVLGNQFLGQSMAIGVDVGVVPTARIHVAGGSLNAGSASLKLDQGFLMTLPEPGAIESDGTNLWWTDGGGIRRRLDNAATSTLAQVYAAGTLIADQTLALLDAKGGPVVFDGTSVNFTGAYAVGVISINTATLGTKNAVNIGTTFAPTSGTAIFNALSLSYAINQTGGANGAVTGLFVDATETAVVGTHNLLDLQIASVSRFTVSRRGSLTITQGVANATVATALTITGAAHTAITLSTENIGANFNFSATKQWATGAIATQREVVFQAPTYAFVGASTITTCATVAITNAPQVGANATFTNPYALWVQAGRSLFAGDLDSSGTIRSTGNTAPPSGAGLELQYTAGTSKGAIICYDRTGAAYKDLLLAGTNVILTNSNTEAARVSVGNNFIIGTSSDLAASSKLQVVASKTVTAAAGAVWNGINFGASTLTLSGATTPITTLNFVTIAAPTITAASAVVTTDFYTCRIGAATFTGAGPASATRSWSLGIDGNTKFGGGQTVKCTDINAAGPYVVLATDYYLEVRYTATDVISINMPAIATVGSGRVIIIGDTGYNANTKNITVVRSGADKINNVAGDYTMNVNGGVIWFKANSTTSNWELI